MKRVGVKFCGGCNPHYDRKKVFDEMKTKFHNIEFVSVGSFDMDTVYEHLVVFAGCHVCCVDYKIYKSKEYILIKEYNDVDFLVEKLKFL